MKLSKLYDAVIFKHMIEKKCESLFDVSNYISNIRVQSEPNTEVIMCIGDKSIETGITDALGNYTFKNFENVPYPQVLFNDLNVFAFSKSDSDVDSYKSFSLLVDEYDLDVIIDSYIRYFGVYHVLNKESAFGKYVVLLDKAYISFDRIANKNISDPLDDNMYAIVESWALSYAVESRIFSWMRGLVIPSIGNEYVMYAVTNLEHKGEVPKIIISKDILEEFLKNMKDHYPRENISIVQGIPSFLYEQNKKLVKKIILGRIKDKKEQKIPKMQRNATPIMGAVTTNSVFAS